MKIYKITEASEVEIVKLFDALCKTHPFSPDHDDIVRQIAKLKQKIRESANVPHPHFKLRQLSKVKSR